jgi:tetratricopeptide (TPR) repeat protein
MGGGPLRSATAGDLVTEQNGVTQPRAAAGAPTPPAQPTGSGAGPREGVDAAARRLIGTPVGENTPEVAAQLYDLSLILAQLGRVRESLDAADRAVRMYRALGAPDLAPALSNLGDRHARLGDRPAALTAFQEAIGLLRQALADDPDASPAQLATSLNHQAMVLAELGRREEAARSATQAADIWRRAGGGAVAADLATAVGNLAVWQFELGRPEDALDAAEEAVALRRGLADGGSTAELADLAMALANLSMIQARTGRPEALAGAEEALALRRRLAATDPARFTALLGRSLIAFATICVDTGRRPDDARSALHECLSVLEPFYRDAPQVYGPPLYAAVQLLDRLGPGRARA